LKSLDNLHAKRVVDLTAQLWLNETMILSDAAKVLNISKSTASRWFKEGKIEKYNE